MVQPGGEPTKTDALERRAERLSEEYAQALKMKKVKDNWPLYRCSPAVMPCAKLFGHDVGDNFMQCIQATQSSYMDYLMMPINHVISLVGSVATKIVKDTENIRKFIGGLRDKILGLVKNIFGVFSNILIGLQKIIIALRDMINKEPIVFPEEPEFIQQKEKVVLPQL